MDWKYALIRSGQREALGRRGCHEGASSVSAYCIRISFTPLEFRWLRILCTSQISSPVGVIATGRGCGRRVCERVGDVAVGEGTLDLFFRWLVEEGLESGVGDTPAAAVSAFVADSVDGVDDESVGCSEVGSESSRFEFAEAESACEMSAKVDVVGESRLLHDKEKRADRGIGYADWVGAGGEEEENCPGE
jgi:hypothetical protein